MVGNWLAKGGPERRKQIVLATKVAGYSMARGYIVDVRRKTLGKEAGESVATRLSKDQIFEACDASLKRLQTEYIDLYQLHWPERYTPNFGALGYKRASERGEDVIEVEEQVAAIGSLIKSGKVRYWGLSNENAFGVTTFVHACKKLGVPLPVSIQNDFAFVDRRFEQDGTAEACSPYNVGGNGIGLLAYGALAGGTLSGKYSDPEAETGKSRHSLFPSFQPRYHVNATREMAAQFAAVARKHGFAPAQLALAWAAGREYMGSVIIGATTMQQLEENLAAFDLKIPEDCAAELEALYLKYERPYFAHSGRMGREEKRQKT